MRTEQVDVAVVGAGPAGLSAARVAARRGARVLVVDEAPLAGGRLVLQHHEEVGRVGRQGTRGGEEAKRLADAAVESGARLLNGATVWGMFPEWQLYLSPTDHRPAADMPDLVRASTVIVATGAVQNPLAIPGWTLPGVYTVGAVQALLNVHRVLPGKQAVIIGVDPLALMVARQLRMAGVNVRAVMPPGPSPYVVDGCDARAAIRNLVRYAAYAPSTILRIGGYVVRRAHIVDLAARVYPSKGLTVWGVPLLLRWAVIAVEGIRSVSSVRVAALAKDGQPGDIEEDWPVDTVVTSAGLSPLVDLVQLAGCPVAHVPELGGYVPLHDPDLRTPIPGVLVAGSVTGVAGWRLAVAQGELAGLTALGSLRKLSLQMGKELERARAGVTAARSQSIPFAPDSERGVARLSSLWNEMPHSRSAADPPVEKGSVLTGA